MKLDNKQDSMDEAKIQELEKQLEELKTKINAPTKVEVTVPPPRKLSKFNGQDIDVTDWIEDARGAIGGMKDSEQIPFLKRHLDGEARKEVGLQPANLIKKAEDIFTILKDAFGERRSAAKLKRLLYSRVQGNNETVRDFTRSLMDLASRLPHETDKTRDAMLKEVIVDNLSSRSVREACDTLLRDHSDTGFADLRTAAIRLGDKDDPTQTAQTRAVENDVPTRQESSEAIAQLTATVQQLVQQQTQLLALMSPNPETLRASQTLPVQQLVSAPMMAPHTDQLFSTPLTPQYQQLVTPHVQQLATSHVNDSSVSTPFQMLPNVQCYKCKNYGHIQSSAMCPLYVPGYRRRGRGRGRGQQNYSNESSMGNDSTPRQ